MIRYSAVLNCVLQFFLDKNSSWTIGDVIQAKKQGEEFVDDFLEFYYQICNIEESEQKRTIQILSDYSNIPGFKSSVIYETLTELRIAYEKQDVKVINKVSATLKSIIGGMESCKRLWKENEERN